MRILSALLTIRAFLYAASQNAGGYHQSGRHTSKRSRAWKETSAGELMIWVGLIIYMGVFKAPQVRDLWAVDPEYPKHSISLFMGQKRWEQLKRFFHVSPPPPEGVKHQIFEKIEPLTTPLDEAFRKYVIPGSMVSFDEMVRFTGRSTATIKLPGKPIPEGFKMSLFQYGYCYGFVFTSPGCFFGLPLE